MDPVNKRRVWEAIKSIRKDRIVVLTTHSMEEADALGDNIGIMSAGRLRAMGTSLFLKNRFGSGYQREFGMLVLRCLRSRSACVFRSRSATHAFHVSINVNLCL
jgi:ABC-type multidrug transport system ATPase subunit